METLCFKGHFKRRMARYKEFCHERAEGVLDEFLRRFCNHWLEDEYEVQSGAERYERSAERKDRRNGHYQRSIITRRGLIKVQVPRGEQRHYKYSLFEKYQRRSKEFDEVVVEALLLGHSGRKATKFFKKLLGAGTVSHDTALRTLRRFDSEVVEWRQRPIRDEAVILVVDAVYFRGVADCVKSAKPVLFALAVYPDGSEEVVGFRLARGESEEAWYRFFVEIHDRGLKKVQLVVRDDNAAIRHAAGMIWPKSIDQLCVFHLMQNIGRKLKGCVDKRRIIRDLQKVYDALDPKAFWIRLKWFLKRWREYEKHEAIQYLIKNAERSIRYFALDIRFHAIARTTNRLERLFEEFNRRIAVFRRFPNAMSCDRWLFALLKQYGKITAALQSQQNS
jgi:putative transposase